MDIEDVRDELRRYVAAQPALAHIGVKKYGASLILFSGDDRDEQKHARLSHISSKNWQLSFPHHSGRWEKTPFMGSPTELVDLLVSDFSFYLEQN